MEVFMLAGIIGASVHGGISTNDSLQKLEGQMCKLNGTLSEYVTNASKETELYS